MDQDHYATLEVSKTASSEEIKTSFRRLAKKWHPDRNRNNREEAAKKFRQVSEAYDVLSRPDKRERYDQVRGLLGAGTGGGLQGLMQAVGTLSGLMDLLTNLGGNNHPTVVMDGQQIKSPEELMAAMARMVNQHEQQTARTRSSTPPKETPKVNGQESERKKLKAKRRDRKRTPEPSRPSHETIPLHWAPPTGDPVTIASITRIEVIPAEGGDGSVGRQAAERREAALRAAAEAEATPTDASPAESDGQDEAAQRAATLREKAAAAAEARMRSSAPPQPASSGDKPPSAADKPASAADKPASSGDKPAEPKPASGRDARGRTDRGRLNEGTAWRRNVPSSGDDPSTGNEPSSSGSVPSTSTSPGSVPGTGGAAEEGRPAAASRQSPLTRALRCAMTAALERRPPLAHLRELGAAIGRALANAAAADAGIGTPPQERRVSFGFSMDVNHYEILGVDRTATQDEIKTAFRRLAKQWHPDKNKTDPEASRKFQAISDSYNVLSDEQKRSLYDALSPLRSE